MNQYETFAQKSDDHPFELGRISVDREPDIRHFQKLVKQSFSVYLFRNVSKMDLF